MVRTGIAGIALLLFALTPVAFGDVVDVPVSRFGVYGGEDVSIGNGSTVNGWVGSGDDVWLSTKVDVNGSVVAMDDIGTAAEVAVTGFTMSRERTDVGSKAMIGSVYAGAGYAGGDTPEVTIGTGSTIGSIWSVDDVHLGSGVNVLSTVHSGDDVYVGSHASVGGRIVAADKVDAGACTILARIDAGNDVDLGASSRAGSVTAGRDVTIRPWAQVAGNVHAGDDVTVQTGVTIEGAVVYVDDLNRSSRVTILGDVVRGSPDAPDLARPDAELLRPMELDKPKFHYGSQSVSIGKGQDVTLAPGSYRDLSVDKDSILRLTAGAYNFRDVWLDKNVSLLADTTDGDVTIMTAKDFATGDGDTIAAEGEGLIQVMAADDVWLGKNTRATARLTAFDDLGVQGDSTVTGSLYADGKVCLGQGVLLNSPSGGEVPEPTTLSLLGLGGLLLLRRRRRRASLLS